MRTSPKNNEEERINFKTQVEVIAGLEQIRQRIAAARRLEGKNLNMNMGKEA